MNFRNFFGSKSIDQELLSSIDNNAALYKIELLLDDGADPNVADSRRHISSGRVGQRPLHYAANWKSSSDCSELVTILINKGADPSLRSKHGHSPLHYFAQEGDVPSVELLLKANAPINALNSSGHTPLHNAAQFGHPVVVELLINQGADVNARMPYKAPLCDGKTPLQSAIYTTGSLDDRLKTINLLISAGADLSISSGKPAISPIQYAESHMNLVKHGFNNDEEDRKRSLQIMDEILRILRS
jgi:Ankyrin repeats (3 copies)